MILLFRLLGKLELKLLGGKFELKLLGGKFELFKIDLDWFLSGENLGIVLLINWFWFWGIFWEFIKLWFIDDKFKLFFNFNEWVVWLFKIIFCKFFFLKRFILLF